MEAARKLPSPHFAQLSPAMAATSYALGHDLPAAQRAMVDEPLADNALPWDIATGAFLALPRYWIPVETGHWQDALQDARAMDATLQAGKAQRPIYGLMQRVWIWPLEALAFARSGDPYGAAALVQKTPLDCYLCLRVRGMIAAQQRDWRSADRWFALALNQAPSLPQAYAEWARMRLDRNDADGAIQLLGIAKAKNSRFADVPEIWGEALLSKGNAEGAVSQFQQAQALAPNWGRNHLKWAEALARSGRREQARDEARSAAALPLTSQERTELNAERQWTRSASD